MKMFRRHHFVIVAILSIVIIGGALVSNRVFAYLGGVTRGASASDIDLQKGLVGWWKMDGNVKDSTPYGADGTATAITPTTDRKGRANSASGFNGSPSFINVGHPSQLNFTGDFSFSYWIKLNNLTSQVVWYPLSKGNHTSTGWSSGIIGTSGAGVCTNVTGTLYFAAGNSAIYGCSSSQMTNNTWYHVAVSVAGTTIKSYINGQLVASNTGTTTYNATRDLNIGRRADGNFYFNGSIDDVRIWNRALSTSEVTAAYSQYDAAPKLASGEKDMAGWWKMDGNAKDSSPYANNATVINTTLDQDRKNTIESAYNFNGTSSYLNAGSSVKSLTSGDFTVNFWAKATIIGNQAVLSQGIPANWPSKLLVIYFGDTTSSGGLRVWWDGSSVATYATSVLNTGWRHVSVTRSGTSLKIYLDGAQVATGTASSSWASTSTFIAATNNNGSTLQFFRGSLDDVRVYTRALSASEIVAQAKSYNSQISVGNLQKGLVGYWPLNANAKDSTPYAANATTFTNVVAAADRKGVASKALTFSSGTSGIKVPHATQFNVGKTTSISAWVKYTAASAGSYQFILSKALNGYELNRTGGNQLRIEINCADSTAHRAMETSGSISSYGTWYNVVATFDASTGDVTLYVNGQPRSVSYVDTHAACAGDIASNTNMLNLGSRNWDGSSNMSGDLDEVRLYNRVLSASEVVQLYREYR